MKIKIDFFSDNFVDAIGAGIYEVSMCYNNENISLYVGESVFVLVRCATHLFEFKKEPCYFGFKNEDVENENITLKFSLLEKEEDTAERKKREKAYIKEKAPKLQTGISDRMKKIDDKIIEIEKILRNEA